MFRDKQFKCPYFYQKGERRGEGQEGGGVSGGFS